MARRVVVGWDGSAAAASALDWAVRRSPDAERIEVVEVDAGRHRVEQRRDPEEAAASVRQEHPWLEVEVVRERGAVGRALAARSSAECLVVLGGRGNEERRLGHRTSTAYRVVLGADGPVAVIPAGYRSGRDVVLGVVDRADARVVALTAAAEAARRHQRLIAVHATSSMLGLADLVDGQDRTREHQEAEALFDEVLAPVRDAHPDLPVVRRTVRGRPSDVLLAASRNAALLVLGRDVERPQRGRPVTHSSMLLSRSPVMVVPPATRL
ncbi:universal stress protein [Amnibacterium endophyticum]|uniref:Universal stress protein n=1 Tax=Amnibacterium endophyticum TaxID=2109337 RepID=A0ABW4LFN6_9MICO